MTTIEGRAPLIIGLGCSTAANAYEIISLIATCLAEIQREPGDVVALATHVRKHGDPALADAAAHYELPLHFLDDDDLAPDTPGTCEAVAAAAGPLLLGKRKSRYATCAIASSRPGFSLAAFGQCGRSSAAIASSTPATSLAGP
jgi:precorrin-3B C17-methyltransferase / cobalt-factor III methyltransferase